MKKKCWPLCHDWIEIERINLYKYKEGIKMCFGSYWDDSKKYYTYKVCLKCKEEVNPIPAMKERVTEEYKVWKTRQDKIKKLKEEVNEQT